MSGIIIFGDEVGIPLALKAMKGIPPNCVVIDPKRQAAQDWLMAQKKGFKVMLHPGATKRNEFTKRVSEMNPTLGLVVSYSRILWPELIAKLN